MAHSTKLEKPRHGSKLQRKKKYSHSGSGAHFLPGYRAGPVIAEQRLANEARMREKNPNHGERSRIYFERKLEWLRKRAEKPIHAPMSLVGCSIKVVGSNFGRPKTTGGHYRHF